MNRNLVLWEIIGYFLLAAVLAIFLVRAIMKEEMRVSSPSYNICDMYEGVEFKNLPAKCVSYYLDK